MRIFMSAATLALTLAACSPSNQTTPPPAGGTACPATITIGPGNSYSPSSCTIKAGATATVKISASGMHPLSGSGADQTVTGAKVDQSFTFTKVGTFNYQCDVHGGGGMKGTITVE